jgi:tripartite-type tricarboxylate transporter receptor subunit TctC
MIKTKNILSSLALAMCATTLAYAQTAMPAPPELGNYPDKPIRLVVPFPAGGTVDGVARTLGPELAKIVGQSVVIENRGGAGGSIGAGLVAQSAPDGYTLLLVLDTHALNPLVYENLPYDTSKDFAPISMIAQAPMVAVTNLDFPPTTIQEWVSYAKKRPGELNFASVGAGSASHLTGELFNQLADVSLEHIPYRGGAPAMNDLIGGQIQMMWGTVPYVQAMAKSGRIRPIGQTGKERSPVFSQIPTMAEQNLPGLEAYGWVGFLAPAGVSDALVKYWHEALSRVMKEEKVAERFASEGFDVVLSSPEEFGSFINAEQKKWGDLIKERKIKLQ